MTFLQFFLFIFFVLEAQASNSCTLKIEYKGKIVKSLKQSSRSKNITVFASINPPAPYVRWTLTSNKAIAGSKTIAKGKGPKISQSFRIPLKDLQTYRFTLSFRPTEHGKIHKCSRKLRVRAPSPKTPKKTPQNTPKTRYSNLEKGVGGMGLLLNLNTDQPYTFNRFGNPGLRFDYGGIYPILNTDYKIFVPSYGLEFNGLWGKGKSHISIRTPIGVGIYRILIQTAPVALFQFEKDANRIRLGLRNQIAWYSKENDSTLLSDFAVGLGFQPDFFHSNGQSETATWQAFAFVKIFAVHICYQLDKGPSYLDRNISLGVSIFADSQ